MTTLTALGPDDQPGDDCPENYPELWASDVPHEVSGDMRMYRAGMKPEQIRDLFGYDAMELQGRFYCALDEEQAAMTAGRPIYDAAIDPKRVEE
ncbi:hypothetical protein [Nocardia grenadensis]|uniref:hypothetical protein n=1 Tax=Nocardia grenadensis TaxID=931537 RepID=UPI003D757A77